MLLETRLLVPIYAIAGQDAMYDKDGCSCVRFLDGLSLVTEADADVANTKSKLHRIASKPFHISVTRLNKAGHGSNNPFMRDHVKTTEISQGCVGPVKLSGHCRLRSCRNASSCE